MLINIRPYAAQDRQWVRAISCNVANRGEPIDEFFPDREVMADLLTSYYTDYESSASLVAEIDGKVVGYLNGSFDNRSYGLVIFWLIVPKLLFKALVRGFFWNKTTLHSLKIVLRNWRYLFVWRKTSFSSHCGHLHIGIAKENRHQDIGRKLVEAFVMQATRKHIHWIIASVNSQNIAACRFFEKVGFNVKTSYPMVGIYQGQAEKYQALQYVKDLS